MSPQDEAPNPAHVELILEHVESLPTLSPIAAKLLALSGSDDAELDEIVGLVELDPSLSAKMLALCRRADRAVAGEVTTVGRAVVLLGLDAVRAATLSVEVFDLFGPDAEASRCADERVDRRGFWLHSLAVACAAELLARSHQGRGGMPKPEEAFLCGLLHDLGKIALDRVVPRTFAEVASLAARDRRAIADVERAVLGIDHHAAGKRLGEHWRLPHRLLDVMWLHGQRPEDVPAVPSRAAVLLVIAADAMARRCGIGWSGNHRPAEEGAHLALWCDLDPTLCAAVETRLAHCVAERAVHLGLEDESDADALLRSVGHANSELGKLHAALEQRAESGDAKARALEAISAFHGASSKRTDVASAITQVVEHARRVLGVTVTGVLWQPRQGSAVQLLRYSPHGRLITREEMFAAGPSAPDLARVLGVGRMTIEGASLLTGIAGRLGAAQSGSDLETLTLAESGGATAVLLHEPAPSGDALEDHGRRVLAACWAGAIAAAAQHEGARQLGERLADVNRRLGETQEQLVETRSAARLAQLAAGAAHEMNNPLTVISGSAQRLMRRLGETDEGRIAERIVGASEKLSDLISAVHFFADPPEPRLARRSLSDVLECAVAEAKRRASADREEPSPEVEDLWSFDVPVAVCLAEDLPGVWIDGDQFGAAVTELVLNAIQSRPKGRVEVRVQIERPGDRLLLSVLDDGCGMDDTTLAHAFDPFFSVKPAGRRAGLGLAKAKRIIDMHGGTLSLTSTPGDGSCATVTLAGWRGPASTAAA